jgi:hypothetical protein
MLKFEISNIIVDEEILDEDDLELVNSFGLRETEMQEQIRLK